MFVCVCFVFHFHSPPYNSRRRSWLGGVYLGRKIGHSRKFNILSIHFPNNLTEVFENLYQCSRPVSQRNLNPLLGQNRVWPTWVKASAPHEGQLHQIILFSLYWWVRHSWLCDYASDWNTLLNHAWKSSYRSYSIAVWSWRIDSMCAFPNGEPWFGF